MHELGIIQNIFKVVAETAKANNLTKVTKVNIKIGKMRQVVPEFLQFAFETVSKGTIAEGAELVLEFVPVRLECKSCGHQFMEEREQPLECPKCHCIDLKIIAGKEIVLDNIEGKQL